MRFGRKELLDLLILQTRKFPYEDKTLLQIKDHTTLSLSLSLSLSNQTLFWVMDYVDHVCPFPLSLIRSQLRSSCFALGYSRVFTDWTSINFQELQRMCRKDG
jgi:hypothetical protein